MQQAFERYYDEYKKLPDSEQIGWLQSVLGPVVKDSASALPVIDELVHPSHLVALLENEPRGIQSVVLNSLPADLAQQVASSLGTAERGSADDKLTAMLRRFFFSDFIAKTDLGELAHVDLLSADQLGRCIQLLGLKELVLTYGNLRIDSEVDQQPERITLSQRLVSEALSVSSPNTLVDHIGLWVLARAMSRREPVYAAYTGQKLPIEASGLFLDAVANSAGESDSEFYDQFLAEVEFVAEHISRFDEGLAA